MGFKTSASFQQKGNPMQTITLNIEGMTCGGCVKSVTSILEVLSILVSLGKKYVLPSPGTSPTFR